MKFLDANIFIYAYYKPRTELDEMQRSMKTKSKGIIKEINEEKLEVLTTVVHLSEVSNILKHSLTIADLESLLMTLCSLDNVEIESVSFEDYLYAIETTTELTLDPNDALAVCVAQKNKIDEILSFDKAFEEVEGIKRMPPPGSSS